MLIFRLGKKQKNNPFGELFFCFLFIEQEFLELVGKCMGCCHIQGI